MSIKGDLQAISLPTLVQFAVQEGGQTYIRLKNDDSIGQLFFEDGYLHHAELTSPTTAGSSSTQVGEEIVYELLGWQTGAFWVQKDVPPPAHSVHQSWDYLLMEGLRQLDERQSAAEEPLIPKESLSEMLSDLAEVDAVEIQKLIKQKEIADKMASKSEELQAIVNNLVNNSNDILGAAVISIDGLLMASSLSGGIDGSRVAAVSAGLISLAGRSAAQLNQGALKQTLIQANNGNIIAIQASEKASFVALLPTNVNLGMAFLECQDAATAISNIL